jgi:hypothetical protein
MLRVLLAASLAARVAVSTDVAIAQDPYSANAVLRGCQLNLGQTTATTPIDLYDLAFCTGEVIALMQISGALQNPICVPRDATADQAEQVIVRYLDKMPERTNERWLGERFATGRRSWICGLLSSRLKRSVRLGLASRNCDLRRRQYPPTA